jgi:hypothetical protein
MLWVVAPSAAQGRSGEVGLLGGHHDNFFYRGGDSAAPASDLVALYIQFEETHDLASGDWTFAGAANAVNVLDINDADYHGFELEGQYKRGPWKASLGFGRILNRLFSESGEATFFDQSEVDFWLRYSVNRRIWIRLRAQVQEWDFDPAENDRDADIDRFAATVRVAATDRLGVRFSYLSEDRDAVGPENNRIGDGVELAFEGAPTDRVTWFLRLRSRDRDYEDASVGDSNFARSDSVDDLNFNIRWLLGERLGLVLQDTYRTADSTRPDRNFTGNQIAAGVFFRFGPGEED